MFLVHMRADQFPTHAPYQSMTWITWLEPTVVSVPKVPGQDVTNGEGIETKHPSTRASL